MRINNNKLKDLLFLGLIWPWHSVFGNSLNENNSWVRSPFSGPCYPREISLYLPVRQWSASAALESEVRFPLSVLAHGIQFKSGQVSFAGVFVL